MSKKFKKALFETEGLLGSGTYGDVYAVTDGVESLALKMLADPQDSKTADYEAFVLQDIIRETFGLGASGHARGLLFDSNRIGLLMPRFGARFGNSFVPKLRPAQVAYMLRPIALYLAASPGMHRDIKPANLLFGSNVEDSTKLVDFSLSTNQKLSKDAAVITLWYRPPEVLLGLTYDASVDIWSFGVVMLNMLTGSQLTRCNDEASAKLIAMQLMDLLGWPEDWPEMYQCLRTTYPSKPIEPKAGLVDLKSLSLKHEDHGQEAIEVLEACLQINPSKRLSWASILKMPFWSTLEPVEHQVAPLKAIPATSDISQFLQSATEFRHAPGATWLTPATFANSKARAILCDHAIFYAKALHFSDETAFWTMWALDCYTTHIGKPQNDDEYVILLSASMFVIAAFNEDLRAQKFSWANWCASWHESMAFAPKVRKTILHVLWATRGIWPDKQFSELHGHMQGLCEKLGKPLWCLRYLAAMPLVWTTWASVSEDSARQFFDGLLQVAADSNTKLLHAD